ncbi:MAG: Lsr2 family protein [Tomitella sp.]|nr:Lsr2 family protein [Tomitella sp.]
MAKRVITELIDDIDKTSPADETVRFALDGRHYEIDLTTARASEFRSALHSWSSHARRPARRRMRQPVVAAPRPDREQVRAIRAWGQRNGYAVADRGRIPDQVIDAFHGQ